MPKAIPTTPVESSNIAAIGYDTDSKTLQVDFKGGKRWQYHGLPAELFAEFEKAESIGKFFAAEIKTHYFSVALTEDE